MTHDPRQAALTTMFGARVKKNVGRLAAWRRREGVTCYRAYDRDIPELPFAADVFVDDDSGLAYLLLTAWAPRHGGGQAFVALADACAMAAAAIVDAGDRFVVQRREPGPGGELAHDELEASRWECTVREGRARFRLRLGARRDPGLFLDHRPTRARVADVVVGRRLLNLFAYTGSFSVQAGLAGAAATLSVDLSASTCRWAEENLSENHLRGPAHRVVQADVLAFLDDDDGERWDVIVIDPPSFSKSRRAVGTFDVLRDHPALIARAARRLTAGGEIWFSCNRRDFVLARDALPRDFVVDDVTAATTPPDFRGVPHWCFRLHR
jgi:23S rRNA (guanine2445-N2)-methyltransferase / 23S rRNA (guanine2069-N7)-methyltransferase